MKLISNISTQTDMSGLYAIGPSRHDDLVNVSPKHLFPFQLYH